MFFIMLRAHFNAVERALLAMGDIAGNAGHNLNIGTPREWLLRSFLSQHLPTTLALGAGEVISADSTPTDQRNQIDLVIYGRDHPKLDYGGGISAFLIEGVRATVEIKSVASYEAFRVASIAARQLKQMRRHIGRALQFAQPLPSPVSYMVAYDGPVTMNTVYEWIQRLRTEEHFDFPALPVAADQRPYIPCPGLDAIFILGKGFLYFDNTPFGWMPQPERERNPRISWVWTDQAEGNFLYFFLLLHTMTAVFQYDQINPAEYMRGAALGELRWGA
jgi:hypothetical protein